MRTTARLTHEKLRFDEPKDLHLVVSLTAPTLPWQEQRPRVCVIPVIDVSGSMEGAKLHFARLSVLKLIDHLAPGDLCGVVTFANEVVTLAPPLELTPARKDALKAAVGELGAQGSTNFAGGLLAALEHAARTPVPAGVAKRVIMFTDGCANVGVATKSPELLPLLDAHLGDATVSAFGYGDDADQELLRDLAARGKGNYAFVRNPEDALAAFARELGGLLSTYARDVELVVRPAAGARLVDVVSDVDAREEGGAVRVHIPDVLSEEVRHVVVGVHLDAAAAGGRAPVALVEGRYVVVDGDTRRSREVRFELPVEVERVVAGEEQRAPTAEVDEVVALAQVVRAQIEAEARARRGEFLEAQQVLHALVGALRSRGRTHAAEACERILGTVADGAAYQASSPFRASMRKGMTRGASSMIDLDAAAFLRKAGVQTTTAQQERMVEAFGGGAGTDPAGAASKPPNPPTAPKTSKRSGGKSSAATKASLTRKRSKRW